MAAEGQVLFPRFALGHLRAALDDTPVVAVNGARQVGKSTLVTEMLERPGGAQVVTLDDATQRDAAAADPNAFVRRDGLLVIDEVQRVPDLLPAIKAQVDRDRRPGRFLLTGSTRLLSTPEMSLSLAGRVEVLDLWPLSQGEVAGRRERFVDALVTWDPALRIESQLERSDYMARICAGGYPEPRQREGRRRQAWFANYVTTVVERMVADVADIERLSAMPRLLNACAARTANELNIQSVATDMGLPYRTVGSYLTHLQTVFLVHLLPAWSRNLTSKVVHRPKLLVTDSGVAAHLIGVDASALRRLNLPAAGALLETFVALELRKQASWSEADVALAHFRDRGGAEVDIVIEARDGRVAGVEVKASSTVRAGDFAGLRLLADRLGDQFVGGVVLYTGNQSVPFGDRLAAVPVSALWDVT